MRLEPRTARSGLSILSGSKSSLGGRAGDIGVGSLGPHLQSELEQGNRRRSQAELGLEVKTVKACFGYLFFGGSMSSPHAPQVQVYGFCQLQYS